MKRPIEIRLKGGNRPAQGNALGNGMNTMRALKGRNRAWGARYARRRCRSLVLLLGGLVATRVVAAEPAAFVSGSAFVKALERPFAAKWNVAELRKIIRDVETARHVSILPDRRLDPTGIRPAIDANETLLGFLERLAAAWNARATVIGNTVYLGPAPAAERLRTLIAMRRQELLDKSLAIPESRRTHLTRGMKFQWEDLDRPADLLGRLGEQYGVAIEGREKVPHDLWAGAHLADANVIEALALVLVQFDLTFAWIDHGRGIRIEPIPERVAIDQAYSPPSGMSADAALARWTELIPGLDAHIEQGKIHVSGTVEAHELVDYLRRNGRVPVKSGGTPKEVAKPGPLSRQRPSLTIQETPIRQVMELLQNSQTMQLKFEYDANELKAAGIDLETRVSFEVKNAPVEVLLKAAFDPLGVKFEIRDRTVKLKPAKKK